MKHLMTTVRSGMRIICGRCGHPVLTASLDAPEAFLDHLRAMHPGVVLDIETNVQPFDTLVWADPPEPPSQPAG
jgi:hypothetical protein